MRKYDTNFPEYVSKVFKERLKELGTTQSRFIYHNADYSNKTTLYRMLRGAGSTNINTLAFFCEKLGLEIIIRPKRSVENED